MFRNGTTFCCSGTKTTSVGSTKFEFLPRKYGDPTSSSITSKCWIDVLELHEEHVTNDDVMWV